MDDKTAIELLTYIANNLQTDSLFLIPNPRTSVEVVGLLDKIAELRGIPKDLNGYEFNKIMDSLQK